MTNLHSNEATNRVAIQETGLKVVREEADEFVPEILLARSATELPIVFFLCSAVQNKIGLFGDVHERFQW